VPRTNVSKVIMNMVANMRLAARTPHNPGVKGVIQNQTLDMRDGTGRLPRVVNSVYEYDCIEALSRIYGRRFAAALVYRAMASILRSFRT